MFLNDNILGYQSRGLYSDFFSAGYQYQPETIRYTSAAGIPNDGTVYFSSTPQQIIGSQIWTLFETFTINAKGILGLPLNTNNLYLRLGTYYPFFGGTLSSNNVDFVSGSALGSFFGGCIHNANGLTLNGINGYLDTTKSPSTLFGSNLYGYLYYINTYTTGVTFGTRDPSFADFDYSEINGVSINNSFTSISSGPSNKMCSLYRTGLTQLKYRKNAAQQTLASVYGGASINPMYIGAYDAYGGPSLYSNAAFQSHMTILNPTDLEIQLLENEIIALQTAFNRL